MQVSCQIFTRKYQIQDQIGHEIYFLVYWHRPTLNAAKCVFLWKNVAQWCYIQALYKPVPPKVLPKQGAGLQILCWKIAQSNQVVQIMTHATSFTQNQSQIWLKILFLNFMLSSLALKWMWNLLKVLIPDEYTFNAPGWANASLECVMFCQNKASAHQLFKWMHNLRLHTSYKKFYTDNLSAIIFFMYNFSRKISMFFPKCKIVSY